MSTLTRRRVLLWMSLALALPVGSSSLPARAAGAARAAEAPTEASLFHDPTPPIQLIRTISEAEPVTALVVAMPAQSALEDTAKEQFLVRLIDLASRYVKVFVLVNDDERGAATTITSAIRRRSGEPGRVIASVTFITSQIDTEWIRDYGPFFGVGTDGEPVLLDNMYRDIRREADTTRSQDYRPDYGHFWRRHDDIAPLYFNEILYRERMRFPALVRTPLQLPGGDLAFTGAGRLFTSTRTLEINGGDERRFRKLAGDYFNVDDVNYLRPLPNGMWHIDMFFKVASPDIVMIGEFGEPGAERRPGYAGDVEREAAKTLAWNRTLIAARLPGVQVVPVPMPSVTQPAGKDFPAVYYRSFVNSLVLNGADGRSAVIVPRFNGLEGMERRVESAYRRAFPGADIHFLNADVLVEDFAGIHCVAVTIPAFSERPVR